MIKRRLLLRHRLKGHSSSIEAAGRIAEGKTGLSRVGYMAFVAIDLMPRAVALFQREYPHVEVALRYIRTQGQKLALADGEIDVGYMIGPFDHSDFHSMWWFFLTRR